MTLHKIDCKNKKNGILSTVVYNTDIKVLYSRDYDNPEFSYIVPDSIMDRFRKTVCE